MDAFGFGVYAPFIPILCQTFSLQAHDMGTALATWMTALAKAVWYCCRQQDRNHVGTSSITVTSSSK